MQTITPLSAEKRDQNDPLKRFREQFHIPLKNGKQSIYFCGNSLGPLPKKGRAYLEDMVKDWEIHGVEGHFDIEKKWFTYHERSKPAFAHMLGTKESEVVAMGTLTANLHFLMATFYKPTKDRFKIIMESGAFPSDSHAIASQAAFHGFDPEEAVIEVEPDQGALFNTRHICDTIKKHGDSVALVLFSGLQYYSGQFFDLESITKTAHKVGAYAGFDLAHAAGNLPMQLHDWEVDFACWCNYKYINSGPGTIAGIYVHEKHHQNPDLPRLTGWWGHDQPTRFLMDKKFVPMPTVDGWQHSNPSAMLLAVLQSSLDIFLEANMLELRKKSIELTSYLLGLLSEKCPSVKVITPKDPLQRGCQLSLIMPNEGKKIFDYISKHGVICDWREPEVIRVAPTPLYNTYTECLQFAELLAEGIEKAQ